MPYRIGHGQKALSLVLKHLWCHGLLPKGTMPPVCPVDRVMLTKVRPDHRIAWTKIDAMGDYEAALDVIRAKAGSDPLAVFELFTFSGEPVANEPAAIDRAQACPAQVAISTYRHNAFTSRSCSTDRQLIVSSFGLPTRIAIAWALDPLQAPELGSRFFRTNQRRP
jgi:hypothetical protein